MARSLISCGNIHEIHAQSLEMPRHTHSFFDFQAVFGEFIPGKPNTYRETRAACRTDCAYNLRRITDAVLKASAILICAPVGLRRQEVAQQIAMGAMHLNAVQFYDWMYRHDKLLPPGEQYDDPMGRATDLRVIAKKIEACKACGIRPMAYGAVYAATKDTFKAHPEWGMYTMDAQPMTFAGWLYYMNVAPSCGWAEHIVEEFRSAVRFGFSGIHMDTYGFPKHVWDAQHRPVELADEFPRLINAAARAVREETPDGGVIFNAVNNWPTETIARAAQDAVYIEVWPPHDTYFDLYRLIREARLLSHRNVILAAYLKAFQAGDALAAERSFRLAWAVISASGCPATPNTG